MSKTPKYSDLKEAGKKMRKKTSELSSWSEIQRIGLEKYFAWNKEIESIKTERYFRETMNDFYSTGCNGSCC